MAFNGIRAILKAPKESAFAEMPEKPLLVGQGVDMDVRTPIGSIWSG